MDTMEPIRRRKIELKPAIAVLLAGLLPWLTACGRAPEIAAGQSEARVERRDFASSVLATGVVQAQVGAEVKVGSRVSGRVDRLLIGIGAQVKKGDVIAELEKRELQATAQQRRVELEMARTSLAALEALAPRQIEKAEADVAKWQASVDLAAKELERKQSLVAEDLASQQELDLAREELDVARAELAAVEKALELTRTQTEQDLKLGAAEIERTQAALDNARALLAYTTITSPIGGVVASVSTQEGETVAAGFNAPTFVTVIDLDRLQVDAYVDEVDIGKIKLGQPATFTVDAFPAREFQGRVEAIYPKAIIQDNVVNYDVVVAIEGDYAELLRPEMTASVTIALEERQGVLAVPVRAVKRERGRNVVYLRGAGGPERREVKVGWQDSGWIEVVEGLEEGQTVLLEAPAGLADNH